MHGKMLIMEPVRMVRKVQAPAAKLDNLSSREKKTVLRHTQSGDIISHVDWPKLAKGRQRAEFSRSKGCPTLWAAEEALSNVYF